jgi:hypothetical protein
MRTKHENSKTSNKIGNHTKIGNVSIGIGCRKVKTKMEKQKSKLEKKKKNAEK